jgi:hypothetical protein
VQIGAKISEYSINKPPTNRCILEVIGSKDEVAFLKLIVSIALRIEKDLTPLHSHSTVYTLGNEKYIYHVELHSESE